MGIAGDSARRSAGKSAVRPSGKPAMPAAGKSRVRTDGRVATQMLLSAGLVKQLQHLAVDRGQDVGAICEPFLRPIVGKSYLGTSPPALRVADPAGAGDAAEQVA